MHHFDPFNTEYIQSSYKLINLEHIPLPYLFKSRLDPISIVGPDLDLNGCKYSVFQNPSTVLKGPTCQYLLVTCLYIFILAMWTILKIGLSPNM